MQVEPFKVICIDDKNIPMEIPIDCRVVDQEVYTVGGVEFLLSSQAQGFHIIEKPLGENCFPYHYWSPKRFAIYTEDMAKAHAEIEEMIKPDVFHIA
jgi:hypothetical protein